MVFWKKMMLLWTALCMALTMSSAQKLLLGPSHFQKSAQEKQVSPKPFEVKAPLYFFKSHGQTSVEITQKVTTVVTCDNKTACPELTTCCLIAPDTYGCCPFTQANCCQDRAHCCPFNMKCDTIRQMCIGNSISITWYEKTRPLTILVGTVQNSQDRPVEHPSSLPCPDDSLYCTDGLQCCKSSEGYSCCRHPDANELLPVPVESVICPDGTHECADGQTCCKLASGEWGCCPLPKAVCCSDGEHCCPHNTTCDVSEGKCLKGDTVMDWHEKMQATNKIKDIVCPDGSMCEDGQTCCAMSDANINSYGCCPLPNAVCCSDGQHCCPQGYHCNLQIGMCVKGFMRRLWFQNKRRTFDSEMRRLQEVKTNIKTFKGNDESKVNVVVCPDQKVTCPDQNTCCSDGKGSFSCCPMPQGVCCADHTFCCPHGYVCDEEPGICRIPKAPRSLASFLKMISTEKNIPSI